MIRVKHLSCHLYVLLPSLSAIFIPHPSLFPQDLLTPKRMVKDVAYWVNEMAAKQGLPLACVNTSVEEGTVDDRRHELLSQDAFVR